MTFTANPFNAPFTKNATQFEAHCKDYAALNDCLEDECGAIGSRLNYSIPGNYLCNNRLEISSVECTETHPDDCFHGYPICTAPLAIVQNYYLHYIEDLHFGRNKSLIPSACLKFLPFPYHPNQKAFKGAQDSMEVASKTSCVCVEDRRLNLQCIKSCYTKAQDLRCNITSCSQQISEHIFQKDSNPSHWVDVTKKKNIVKISLTSQAINQFGLYSQLPFYVAVTASNVRDCILNGGTVASTYLSRVQNMCVANKIASFKQIGRIVTRSLSQHRPVFWAKQKKSMYLVLYINIAGGHIRRIMNYAPEIMKRHYYNLPPTQFPRIPLINLLPYSDHLIVVQLGWTPIDEWNAQPISFDVVCLTIRRLRDYIQVLEDPRSSDFAWNKAMSYSENVKSFSVPWPVHSLEFNSEHKRGLHLCCRLRAVNANGPGSWGDMFFGSVNLPLTQSVSTFPALPAFVVEKKRGRKWVYDRVRELEKQTDPIGNTEQRQLVGVRNKEIFFLPITNQMLDVGCYDWVADRWFFVLHVPAERGLKEYWLAATGNEQNVPQMMLNTVRLVKLQSLPIQMICLPLLSRIVWTEELNQSGIFVLKAFQYNIEDAKIINIQLSEIVDECVDCETMGWLLISGSIALGSITSAKVGNSGFEVDDTIIVQTSTGLWKLSLDWHQSAKSNKCPCKHIQNLTGIVVTSIAGVFLGSFFGTIRNDSLMWFLSDNGISPMSSSSYRLIQPSEMEYVYCYPRSVKEQDVDQVQRVMPLPEFQYRLPWECIFPNVSNAEVTMQSLHTASVAISTRWNDSDLCVNISKPRITYHINYWVLDQNCNDSQSESCSSGPQQYVSKVTSDRDWFEAVITGLEINECYKMNISIEPSLGKFRELWYGKRKPQPYERQFYSTLEPKPTTVDPIVYGVTVAFAIIILSSLLTFICVMCRKKWYVYLQLQELTKEQITLEKILGNGNFGQVHKASINLHADTWFDMYCPGKRRQRVLTVCAAVKILKESATTRDQRSFIDEAILIASLKHPNIIKAFGICMDEGQDNDQEQSPDGDQQPSRGHRRPRMLALEFMDGGSLDSYLRKETVQSELAATDLWQMAIDVATAVEYLHHTGIIHRDLSAKNCLVRLQANSQRPEFVKIADFGLAKNCRADTERQYETDSRICPICYTAPEGFVLEDSVMTAKGKFSIKSDVWSFGVVLWEIFSWAAVPFGPCSIHDGDDPTCPVEQMQDAMQVVHHVCWEKKSLKDLPHPCTVEFTRALCNIMYRCWLFDDSHRPTINEVIEEMKEAKGEMTSMTLKHRNAAQLAQLLENRQEGQLPQLDYDPYGDFTNDQSGYTSGCINIRSVTSSVSDDVIIEMNHIVSDPAAVALLADH